MDTNETRETLEIRESRWGFAIFSDGVKMTPWKRDRVWVEGVRERLAYALSDEGQAWARQVLGS